MCTGTSSHVVDSRDTDRLQHLNRTAAAAAAAKYPLCTRLRQDVTDVLQLLATPEDATAEPCLPPPHSHSTRRATALAQKSSSCLFGSTTPKPRAQQDVEQGGQEGALHFLIPPLDTRHITGLPFSLPYQSDPAATKNQDKAHLPRSWRLRLRNFDRVSGFTHPKMLLL